MRAVTKTLSVRILGIVAVTMVSACHPRPRSASEPCLGKEYLVVRNDSRETVDVFQEHEQSKYDLIGTVGPGVSELQFPSGQARAGRYVARRIGDGRWMASTSGGTRGTVSFDVECTVAR